MYNRYILKSDGTYQKNTVQEKPPFAASNIIQEQIPRPDTNTPSANPSTVSKQHPRNHSSSRSRKMPANKNVETSANGFLWNLLPNNMDTSDLLIIVLLLLISGDCNDDRGNALLTLALYLLM